MVKAYAGPLFAICLGLLGNRHDAEDMAQQTLVKAFTEIRNLRDPGRFGPWIARIARHLYLDVVRRRRPLSVAPPAADNNTGCWYPRVIRDEFTSSDG